MEQITEKFAKILITSIFANYPDDTIISWVEHWKTKGYIKQSREDKIRQKINWCKIKRINRTLLNLYPELIKILDNKIKELKNEKT